MHVQFYLTLLDTYVPDEKERARGVRRGGEHPVDHGARPSSASGGSTRSSSCASCDHGGRPAGVPAQPDLLRRLHRGAVLLRRVRLRLLPALARPAQRPRVRHQLGVPRRVDAHGVRLRRGRHGPRARSRTCSTTRWPQQVREMLAEAVECEAQFAEDLLGQGVAGLSPGRHARLPASTSPTGGWPSSASSRCTARANPLAFMELQDVQELSNFFERRVSAYQVGVTGDGRLRRRLLSGAPAAPPAHRRRSEDPAAKRGPSGCNGSTTHDGIRVRPHSLGPAP